MGPASTTTPTAAIHSAESAATASAAAEHATARRLSEKRAEPASSAIQRATR